MAQNGRKNILDLDVGYTKWLDLSRRNDPVRISSITYGVVPEGMEANGIARPLEHGIEYCVEVAAHLSDLVVNCFIYQP